MHDELFQSSSDLAEKFDQEPVPKSQCSAPVTIEIHRDVMFAVDGLRDSEAIPRHGLTSVKARTVALGGILSVEF